MGKQFIERNAVVIGIVTAVLIVGTLFVSLTVTREDLTGGYKLTVEFSDAKGTMEPEEFEELFNAAGLKLSRIIPTKSMVSIIEGFKA